MAVVRSKMQRSHSILFRRNGTGSEEGSSVSREAQRGNADFLRVAAARIGRLICASRPKASSAFDESHYSHPDRRAAHVGLGSNVAALPQKRNQALQVPALGSEVKRSRSILRKDKVPGKERR